MICTVSIPEMSSKNHPQLVYINWAWRCISIRSSARTHSSTVSGWLWYSKKNLSEATDRFFFEYQSHPLTVDECVRALDLMEMQRHTQLMYTSCGWFFDDISGIETVQIIAYAARVIQLSQELFHEDAAGLELTFLDKLSKAKSNVAFAGDGAKIYTQQ